MTPICSVCGFLAVFFVNTCLRVSATNNSSITISTNQITPTTSLSQSPTSLLSSTNQSSLAISPTSSWSQPFSTSTRPTGKIDYTKIPLPPDDDRRDFDLVANTRMKWVPYLLDRNSEEFIFMADLIQDKFNSLFAAAVPGFIKTKMSEFQQDQVTFILIVYTKKEYEVTQAKLDEVVTTYLNSEEDIFKIYQKEIKPRFQEMPPDPNTKPVYGGTAKPVEKVNHFISFLEGFGVALGIAAGFTILGIIKYKFSKMRRKNASSEKQSLSVGLDNEGME